MNYYTFRLIGQTPLRVECCKWDDCLNDLLDVYIVYPYEASCNCMATKRECKHVVLARAIIKPEYSDCMHNWKWDEKNSWQWVEDIPTIEEVLTTLCR